MAKRHKLKQSLYKLLNESNHQKSHKEASRPTEKKSNKQDSRILWHSWSDGIRTLLPYRSCSGATILTIGDGDLSFSRSLSEFVPGDQLICTTLDDEKEAAQKYPLTYTTNQQILESFGATILGTVDGTKLSLDYLGKKLDKKPLPWINTIVFNFPHTGEGIKDRLHNIRSQQQLLLGFLKAAALLLEEQQRLQATNFHPDVARHAIMARSSDETNANTEEYTLHFGCRPRPEIHLTSWVGDPYDDWNIKGLASSLGKDRLQLIETFSFDCNRYSQYRHCRTIGSLQDDDDMFVGRTARTFVFIVPNNKK